MIQIWFSPDPNKAKVGHQGQYLPRKQGKRWVQLPEQELQTGFLKAD